MTSPTTGAPAPAVFNFQSLDVRAFADDAGEPWFCAADVCAVLGYRNPRTAIANHCREKGVLKRDTPTESGALVCCQIRTWQQWEAGDRKMHPGLCELFKIKTGYGDHHLT